ncbi:MAG: hypothetical protein Q8O26_03495 [Phreatobacter sp.]|uniref:hypothetical protein n=1 Tax=Phreatobacter sp. TaxID=1966341 RepID=UPI0027369271|nr:hypothetical protein [Phreatobacter sp.]MDP2800925.1 hypothetical protein [Phreatobacter sp.]
MEYFVFALAFVGGAAVLYIAATLAIGIFGPKEYIGANWIKKRLVSMGVDPSTIPITVLRKAARNAESVTRYGPSIGDKFNNIEFQSQLDFRAHLIYRYLSGNISDSTELELVKMFFKDSQSN